MLVCQPSEPMSGWSMCKPCNFMENGNELQCQLSVRFPAWAVHTSLPGCCSTAPITWPELIFLLVLVSSLEVRSSQCLLVSLSWLERSAWHYIMWPSLKFLCGVKSQEMYVSKWNLDKPNGHLKLLWFISLSPEINVLSWLCSSITDQVT